MSLPDRLRNNRTRLLACAIALALVAGSGCTVRPLYSSADPTTGTAAGATAGLQSISIKPQSTRYGQEVRNHLIFLLNGGQGQPAEAAYSMEMNVTSAALSAAVIQVDDEPRPTAGTLRMTASYTIKDSASGEVVATGSREVSSSFDRPRQEFASMRAQRDAENRAARELAEFLRLDIGQKLATR